MRLRKIFPDPPDTARQIDNALKFECTDCERKYAVVLPDHCFVDLDGPLLETNLRCKICGARRQGRIPATSPKVRRP